MTVAIHHALRTSERATRATRATRTSVPPVPLSMDVILGSQGFEVVQQRGKLMR